MTMAVASGAGTDNLVPLGEAANTEHIRLEAAGAALPAAQASAAVNSLGLLDLVEIAARGLASGGQYRVYLAENNQPRSTKLISSGGAVRGVLEVSGGTARRLGIAVGDRMTPPFR